MKIFENDGTGPHGRTDEDGSQHQGCGSRSAHRESKRSMEERASINFESNGEFQGMKGGAVTNLKWKMC